MTDFQADVIKILLDKLLLAAIAAIFGYYLSRLLEDHRSRNHYWEMMNKQRREANRSLFDTIVEYHEMLIQSYDLIERMIEKDVAGKRRLKRDVERGHKIADDLGKFRRKVISLTALMSPGVGDALIKYLDATNISDELLTANFGKERPTKEKLNQDFITFIHACGLELGKNPFE